MANTQAGRTLACIFYEQLTWPFNGYALQQATSLQAPTGSRYTLPGAFTNSTSLGLAANSGGWYNIGQAARPGSWCYTVHEQCASEPGGCAPVGPPTTTTCGANASPGPLVLGGIDNNTLYHDGTCLCNPGAYLRPVDNIKTRGCTLVADCRSGAAAACPGVNVLCDWASGSNACVCKQGWKVRAGQNVYVEGCSEDINECVDTSNCVKPNTVCTNTAGSYSCSCKEGYMLRPGDRIWEHGCVLPCEWLGGLWVCL